MKNKNIVLEGCDGVGKTTIAQMLRNRYNMSIYSPNRPGTYKEGVEINLRVCRMMRYYQNHVYDRAFLSEFVYAPIFRGYEAIYAFNMSCDLQDNTLFILLTATLPSMKERYDGEFVNIDDLSKISTSYLNAFNKLTNKHKIIISTTNKTPEKVLQEILNYKWR